MKVPFTLEQFLDVFKDYNLSVCPLQIIFYLLALIAILLSLKKVRQSDKIIPAILAFFWIWMGIAYHIINFTAINKAAYVFGAAFILQGILFLYIVAKQKISFRFRLDIYGIAGSIFIFFALILYPVFGYLQGHIYPSSPTFGLPCPTTIFTFGILLWTDKKFPMVLLIIPVIWSAIGFSAAFALGFKEDIGLLISGLLFTLLIVFRNKTFRKIKTGLIHKNLLQDIYIKHFSNDQYHNKN
jgi:hypothetical protein